MKKKKIYFLSVGRSDFQRLLPIIQNLNLKKIDYKILISGAHYNKEFGNTWKEIRNITTKYQKAINNKYKLDYNAIPDNLINCSIGVAKIIKKDKPNILVLFGDRYEMLAGALATLGTDTLLVHIHGGSITKGAIDDIVRHSLTKFCHYHLVSNKIYAKRVLQLGENKKFIKIVGAPGLDKLKNIKKISNKKFFEITGKKLQKEFVFVCFHSVTTDLQNTSKYIKNLIKALKIYNYQCVITYPNADPGSTTIIKELIKLEKESIDNKIILIKNAGEIIFYNLMKKMKCIVGNSSAGIVEAGFYKKPVINIGNRQIGKIFSDNIIKSSYSTNDILKSFKKIENLKFIQKLKKMSSPYGDGKSGVRISKILTNIKSNSELKNKFFRDL